MALRLPTLHVLAGPNGAGKTTLYQTRIKSFTAGVEFVNADILACRHFGHLAATVQESEVGQKLAKIRRGELIAARQSLVTESTFSHPSKLELITKAKAAGYRVVIYHVNVSDPDLAVLRVKVRVGEGGHPVPEDKIRARYERNQALIREAVLIADRAYVFDNSRLDQPHRRVVSFDHGHAKDVIEPVPRWAQILYASELGNKSP